MPLPSSGRLSMSQIANEFNVSLSSVALNADLASYIDISVGSKTKISDFYGAASISSQLYNSQPTAHSSSACDLSTCESHTFYHDNGSTNDPVVGTNIYRDSSGNPLFKDGTFKYQQRNGSCGYITTSSSTVTAVGLCQSTEAEEEGGNEEES